MTHIQLVTIARENIPELAYRTTLEPMGSDEYDFFETSVWSLEAALKEAYELGKRDGKEVEETENYIKFKEALVNTISAEALEDYILGNPDDLMMMNATDVIDKITTNKKCPKCRRILYLSDLPQYDYVCTNCDENFYECEVR